MYAYIESLKLSRNPDLNYSTVSLLSVEFIRMYKGDFGHHPRSSSNGDIPISSLTAELYENSAAGKSSSQSSRW